MLFRISFFAGILLSTLFMPYWATFLLMLVALFYFDSYIEIIGQGLLIDLLYGVKDPGLLNMYFFTTVLSIFSYLFVQFLKKKLRFYPAKQKF